MTTWSELLRTELALGGIDPGSATVPFGLPPVAGDAWSAEEIELTEDGARFAAATRSGLEASFAMKFFPDTRAVECWGEISHRGTETVRGISQSLTLDTGFSLPAEFLHGWVRTVNGVRFVPDVFPPYDFGVVDRQLFGGRTLGLNVRISNRESGRSSDENLPCAILGDESGTAGLAFMLEWSGLWTISFDRTSTAFDSPDLRISIGMWGLTLDLEPGQSLPLPRLLITGFDGDLEAGSNSLRRHIRRHVTPRLDGREVLPPVCFNTGFEFATGSDFTQDTLKPMAAAVAEAGMEYFVMDAGWYRGGHPDGSGNWNDIDRRRFPDGIEPFADYIRSLGMKYGTWFEPEWAHVSSDLYREHPEWFWSTPAPRVPSPPTSYGFFPFVGENYVLMNFGLPEVQEWWVERITRAYHDWGMRWIRWDYNHDPAVNWNDDAPGKVGWRQIQHTTGLYATLDAIIAACPDLFIEQCASGGHRIDLGMVRRAHSFWMNDFTDQSDIVRAMQHGLNSVLPGNFANTNVAQHRHDYTDYDYFSHAGGGFGYSGRLNEAPPEDRANFARAIARFKEYRHLLMGDYTRPTGLPLRADEYTRVEFSDGGERLVMEFNQDGPGTVRIETGRV